MGQTRQPRGLMAANPGVGEGPDFTKGPGPFSLQLDYLVAVIGVERAWRLQGANNNKVKGGDGDEAVFLESDLFLYRFGNSWSYPRGGSQ